MFLCQQTGTAGVRLLHTMIWRLSPKVAGDRHCRAYNVQATVPGRGQQAWQQKHDLALPFHPLTELSAQECGHFFGKEVEKGRDPCTGQSAAGVKRPKFDLAIGQAAPVL